MAVEDEGEKNERGGMERRSFLKAGVGAAVLGLAGCGASRSPLAGDGTPGTSGTGETPRTSAGHHAPAPATVDPPAARVRARTVTREPARPVDHWTFVSRPDLTPVGVSIETSTEFDASDLTSMYVFCAPKSPLAANPGRVPAGGHGFPNGATPGLMIVDTAGELVWFKPLPGGHEIPFNFRVQTYNGRPTMTWFQGTVKGGHASGGHYVLADRHYEEFATVTETEVPCDLHEFILTPDGTALHTAYEPGVRTASGVPLIVGHAQEVDVASNELLFDWPCYPAVSPELSYVHPYGDYFHINAIDLWPGPERHLLVSSRNTSTVYLVDRATKEVIWRLGGKRSDFAMGPDTRFYYQHDARALADGSGVSLFDDASPPCPETYASGKVLTLDQTIGAPGTKTTLDQTAGTATLRHRYSHTDHEFTTPSQGNCQLLPDTSHVVGWGYLPFFSAFGPSPEDTMGAPLILDGRMPEGAASYRTFLFEWKGYPPTSELRLVVRGDGGGRFTAWVSWNGATEVASWRLLAGGSAASLATVTTAARDGFETTIRFTRDGATAFEVEALDAEGRVLGRTEIVAAS